MEEAGLAELEVASGDESVRITMPSAPRIGAGGMTSPIVTQSPALEPTPVSGQAPSPGSQVVAPMAGTFYSASHPDAPAFVEVGQQVQVGQTLCIIESMKMMHEIPATVSGTLTQISVENGQPISTGEVLFRLS